MEQQNSTLQDYSVMRKIGEGAFGAVYKCINQKTQEIVAIKLESKQMNQLYLQSEYQILLDLNKRKSQKNISVPKVYLYDELKQYSVLVMQLLGPSLRELQEMCRNYFSAKTTAMLAIQMISQLEYLHDSGILHRDIKPENFMMGLKENEQKVYLIDFGLSQKLFIQDGTHIPFNTDQKFVGSARYASHNAHLGYQQSRRDDLESLGYVFIFMLKGSLPWQNLQSQENDYDSQDMVKRQQHLDRISQIKNQTTVEKLCQKDVPKPFQNYLKYVKNLTFTEHPNYDYLKKLFVDFLKVHNHTIDNNFDWYKIVSSLDELDDDYRILPTMPNSNNSDQQIKSDLKRRVTFNQFPSNIFIPIIPFIEQKQKCSFSTSTQTEKKSDEENNSDSYYKEDDLKTFQFLKKKKFSIQSIKIEKKDFNIENDDVEFSEEE